MDVIQPLLSLRLGPLSRSFAVEDYISQYLRFSSLLSLKLPLAFLLEKLSFPNDLIFRESPLDSSLVDLIKFFALVGMDIC